MEKIIAVVCVVFVLFVIYVSMNGKADYELLNVEETPVAVQKEISSTNKESGFSVFSFEDDTYIYYKAAHEENEYISVDLTANKRGKKFVVTASVSNAVSDEGVSYEKVLKLEKVAEKDIVLKENK